MDACNARFGRGTVVPARAGLVERQAWSTKFEMRTPAYTTRLGDLPVVGSEMDRRLFTAQVSAKAPERV